MSEFEIKINALENAIPEFKEGVSVINGCIDKSNSIMGSLGYMGDAADSINRAIKLVVKNLDIEKNNLNTLALSAEDILKIYKATELKILDNIDGSKNDIKNSNKTLDNVPGNLPGNASIDDNESDIWDNYFVSAIIQALLGDFYTDDSNFLGVLLSVGIGFIPVVGQIADFRDLLGDIYNLIDDGPTTAEWVALGFTLVGIIPGLGDIFKHSDEVADLLKRSDIVKNIMNSDVYKYADDAIDAVSPYIRRAKDFIDSKTDNIVRGAIDKVDDVVRKTDDYLKHHNIMNNFKDSIDDFTEKADEFLKREIHHFDTVETNNFKFESDPFTGYNYIKEVINNYIDDIKEDVTVKFFDYATAETA